MEWFIIRLNGSNNTYDQEKTRDIPARALRRVRNILTQEDVAIPPNGQAVGFPCYLIYEIRKKYHLE